ncbi:hypothetical protein Tco_1039422, partial [Tanacetum coccineum]
MEPDIENMTLDEYRKYEAEKERRLWDNDRFKNSPKRIGAENIKRMGHEIVQDSIWEHDDDSEEDQEEDAPATPSILDELLDEYGNEILNVTMVDEEADFNPTKGLEEFERLLAMRPQTTLTEIQHTYTLRCLLLLPPTLDLKWGDGHVTSVNFEDEAGGILTDEQNDFLFADASRMEEIETYTIDDDQINSNIQFDSVKGNVNSGSVEKDTHVYDQCALETLARNAYAEAAKQQRFAQKKALLLIKRLIAYDRRAYVSNCQSTRYSLCYLYHAGCKDDCKSTSGRLQFLGGKLSNILRQSTLTSGIILLKNT